MHKQFNATAVFKWLTVFSFLLVWQWSGDGIVLGLENGFDMGIQNMEMSAAISDDILYGRDLMVGGCGSLGWLYKGVWLPLTGGRYGAVLQLLTLNALSVAEYVPADLVTRLFGNNEGFGVLMAATIGVPLYACGGGTIPLLIQWLYDGMSLGSAAAFMLTGPATKITNLGAVKIVLGGRRFVLYIGFIMAFALVTGLVVDRWIPLR